MSRRPADTIKREQQKSFILKELAQLLHEIAVDEPALLGVHPTHVDFSRGKGVCDMYFSCLTGKEGFEQALPVLKLYKPSLRRALSKLRQSHYTPELVFKYDPSVDVAERMHDVFERIEHDNEPSSDDEDSSDD